MPYERTAEQSYPARAGKKRRAAERHEALAARLRAESEELEERWEEYQAGKQQASA